jgi:hypothetical protein
MLKTTGADGVWREGGSEQVSNFGWNVEVQKLSGDPQESTIESDSSLMVPKRKWDDLTNPGTGPSRIGVATRRRPDPGISGGSWSRQKREKPFE